MPRQPDRHLRWGREEVKAVLGICPGEVDGNCDDSFDCAHPIWDGMTNRIDSKMDAG